MGATIYEGMGNKKELLLHDGFLSLLAGRCPGYDFYSHGVVTVAYDPTSNSGRRETPVFFYHTLNIQGEFKVVDRKRIVIETSVPAGFFDNSDIKPTSVGGHLWDCVEVELAGSEQTGVAYITRDFIVACDVTHANRYSNPTAGDVSLRLAVIEKLIAIHKEVKSQLKVKVRKVIRTYGADPEFIVQDTATGRYLPASTYIADSLSSQIGCDGAGFQLELRPTFSTSPRGLVRNFKALLEEFAKKYSNYDIIWDGNHSPLGGHIHLNVFIPAERDRIIRELDKVYTSVLARYNGSARGSYAQAGAYRKQNWGFEYRSFSSFYWISPETARKTLKLIGKIAKGFSCEDLAQEIESLSASLAKPWQKSLLHNWGVRRIKKTKNTVKLSYSSDCEMSAEFKEMVEKEIATISVPAGVAVQVRIFPARKTRVGVASFPVKHANANVLQISDFGRQELASSTLTDVPTYTINVAIHYLVRMSSNRLVLEEFFKYFKRYIKKQIRRLRCA